MPKLILIAALGALALVPQSASAAAKHRVVVDRYSQPYEFALHCSDFGPYDFDILIAGQENVAVTDVIGAGGELLQTVLKIRFDETDTNSETGKRLTLTGAVHSVLDYASNTRTLSGKVYDAHDGGRLFHDVGRITLTLDTNEPLFVAGPHDDVFFGGGIDAVGCAALAG